MLGWEPSIHFTEGLRETIAWARQLQQIQS
jgi:nucleoside-diphosphate-sugar epimerase